MKKNSISTHSVIFISIYINHHECKIYFFPLKISEKISKQFTKTSLLFPVAMFVHMLPLKNTNIYFEIFLKSILSNFTQLSHPSQRKGQRSRKEIPPRSMMNHKP